jgi:hypothetical protein
MHKTLFILAVLLGGKVMAQAPAPSETAKPITKAYLQDSIRRENDILTCKQHRYGIYRAFEEFRRNSPSITQEFVFAKTSSNPNKPYLEAEKDQLQLVDPRGRKSRVLDKIWGFCDSSGVYLYFEDTYQLGKRYNPLSNIGRYCYFVDEYDLKEKSGARSASSKKANKRIRLEYVLNINNGEVYEFSVDALRQILSKDAELLKQFEKEAKPGHVKYQYLLQFNQRNPDTVKPLKQ